VWGWCACGQSLSWQHPLMRGEEGAGTGGSKRCRLGCERPGRGVLLLFLIGVAEYASSWSLLAIASIHFPFWQYPGSWHCMSILLVGSERPRSAHAALPETSSSRPWPLVRCHSLRSALDPARHTVKVARSRTIRGRLIVAMSRPVALARASRSRSGSSRSAAASRVSTHVCGLEHSSRLLT
jgi:hypothetical protein